MSMFEDSRYRWRETYFVLFDAKHRPPLTSVTKALSAINKRFELGNLNADSRGQIDSLTLISPDDFAALDICYTSGDEVLEQGAALIDELKKLGADMPPPVPWEQIKRYDGRFDVLHFERVPEDAGEDADEEEMLDPSALLVVLGELAKLTGGVAIDPQAGTFLGSEDEE
ncbi:MAG: hypothetical protein LLG00_12110 [Planctomycetaceae bacterium]|nr:hypothetical protein [Planctomycetaceae bacterium]